ncbi:hypothetical protein AAHA92_04110 [Salvia divinorum]|uniref:Uncharacterized protein n=1 Tax=Salvia divinorum TaxID=28513 RepID=A0ABD1HZ07_SALDI
MAWEKARAKLYKCNLNSPVPLRGPAPDFFLCSVRLTRVTDEADVTRVRFPSRLRGLLLWNSRGGALDSAAKVEIFGFFEELV